MTMQQSIEITVSKIIVLKNIGSKFTRLSFHRPPTINELFMAHQVILQSSQVQGWRGTVTLRPSRAADRSARRHCQAEHRTRDPS